MYSKSSTVSSAKRLIFIVLILIICSNDVSCSSVISKFSSSDLDASAGKAEMDKLYSFSQLPRFGPCWKAALEGIDINCKQMNPEIQSRIALRFTSCFNEMTYSSPIICEINDPLQGCLKALDSNGLNTFRDFFLQTQNMCFYLSSQLWREATDRSVNKLTSAASEVQKNLEISEERQRKMLESQEHSEKLQSGLMKDQHALFNVVVRFKDLFDDFRVSVEDHRLIFDQIFEKLSRTQKLVSWIQGEMSLLDMMGFYFISLIFGFIASSTRRTRQARFWLVCLAITSLGTERYIYSFFDQSDKNIPPEQIQEWIWYLRRSAAVFGFLIILWAAASYQDYQTINNNMLLDLHQRTEMLMEFVNALSKAQAGQIPIKALTEAQVQVHESSLKALDEDNISELSNSTDFSNYTNDSDTENLTNELEDIAGDIGTGSVTAEVEKKKPFYERLFGSLGPQNNENKAELNFVTSSPISPISHSYNLRERKKTPVRENSVLRYEGPTMFANTVKKSFKRSQAKFKEERSQHISYFSSDDEF